MRDTDAASEVNWSHAVYQLGKLDDVVHILAVGEGDARSRLREATPYLRALVPGMLPVDERIRFRVERALATLRRFHNPAEYARLSPNSPETEFDSTLNRIHNSTASKIALDLYGAHGSLGDMVDEYFRRTDAEIDSPERRVPVFLVDAGDPEALGGAPEGAVVIIDNIPCDS